MNSMDVFNIQVLIGLTVFLCTYFFKPDLLKIDKKFAGETILSLIVFFSIASVITIIRKQPLPSFIPLLWYDGLNSLLGVFWEESFYVLPFIIIYSYLPGKKFIPVIPIMVLFAYNFAQGHQYQGDHWPVFMAMPFVSFWISRKRGILTSMLIHICYDVIIITTSYGFYHLAHGLFNV